MQVISNFCLFCFLGASEFFLGGGRLRDELRNIVLQSGINFKDIGSLKYGKM